jgi:hypothetical protein
MASRSTRNSRRISLIPDRNRKTKIVGLCSNSNDDDTPDDGLLQDIMNADRRHSSYQIRPGPLIPMAGEDKGRTRGDKYRGSLNRNQIQRTEEIEQRRSSRCYQRPLDYLNNTLPVEENDIRYDARRISRQNSVQSKDKAVIQVETKTKKRSSTTTRKTNQTTSKPARGEVFVWQRNQDIQTNPIHSSTTSAKIDEYLWHRNDEIFDTNRIQSPVNPTKLNGYSGHRNDVTEGGRSKCSKDGVKPKIKSPTKTNEWILNGNEIYKPSQMDKNERYHKTTVSARESFYEQNLRESRSSSVFESCAGPNCNNHQDEEPLTSVEIFVTNNFKERRRLRISERRLHGIGDENDNDYWRDDDVSTLSGNSVDDERPITASSTSSDEYAVDFNPQRLSLDEYERQRRASPCSTDDLHAYSGRDETYTIDLLCSPLSTRRNSKEYHSVSTPTTMSETEFGSTEYNHIIGGDCDGSSGYRLNTISTFVPPPTVDGVNADICIDQQYQTNVMDIGTDNRRESLCSHISSSNNNRRISGTSVLTKGNDASQSGPVRREIGTGNSGNLPTILSPSHQMRNEGYDRDAVVSNSNQHISVPKKSIQKSRIKGGTVEQKYYFDENSDNKDLDKSPGYYNSSGHDNHVDSMPKRLDPLVQIATDKHEADRLHKQPQIKSVQMVEVAPMVFSRLRSTKDVYECIKSDFYIPVECETARCKTLGEVIFCIQDVDYVICPSCKALNKNPLGLGFFDGGVGVGFTFDELSKMQLEIAATNNNNNNNNSDNQHHHHHHHYSPPQHDTVRHNGSPITTGATNQTHTFRIERYQV